MLFVNAIIGFSENLFLVAKCSVAINTKGPNYWKLNNGLLKNEDYLSGVKSLLFGQHKNYNQCASKID